MFATSNDILNWVLSLSVIALTFFLCWAIYYFIAGVAKLYRLIKRGEKIAADIEETVGHVKDKVSNSASNLMMFGEIAGKAMEFIKNWKEKSTEKKAARAAKKTKGKK